MSMLYTLCQYRSSDWALAMRKPPMLGWVGKPVSFFHFLCSLCGVADKLNVGSTSFRAEMRNRFPLRSNDLAVRRRFVITPCLREHRRKFSRTDYKCALSAHQRYGRRLEVWNCISTTSRFRLTLSEQAEGQEPVFPQSDQFRQISILTDTNRSGWLINDAQQWVAGPYFKYFNT